MFNRRKTPLFTAFLWKTPGVALRCHRSGDRAPDGQHHPPHGRTSRHGTTSARRRRVSDPDEPPFTAPVNGCVVLRFAASLRVTGAFRGGLGWQLWPAGDSGRRARRGGRRAALTYSPSPMRRS